MILCDAAAERAVLAGICRYGEDAYLDVADIIQSSTFTVDSNVIIYKVLKHICESSHKFTKIDLASIYSAAQDLTLTQQLEKKEEALHLKAILEFPVALDNVRRFAAKIRKLEIARLLRTQLETAGDKLLDITGNETVTNILGIAEDAIFDFSSLLNDTENHPEEIGKDIDDFLQNLIDNPVDQVGIPTGFPIYDQSIGGGLRRGTVNVIGARPKTGKSLMTDNIGLNISKLGIPVLNMDTEMNINDHKYRILARMTEIEINSIENGKFAESPNIKQKIIEAATELKGCRLFHKTIAGMEFEEQLAIMRRWLLKEVGLDENGHAKPCVIIYDYLKLMDSKGISQDMKEYQVLGFMMTSLHNFAVRYQVPILAFMQLNRDGINAEDTSAASGSDRIIWLCSNFSIFKKKTDEEIAQDGPGNGNRKLIPIVSRHGGGLDSNNYINCHMKGWCAKITEGRTKLEIMNGINKEKDGFELKDDNDNNEPEIPFD